MQNFIEEANAHIYRNLFAEQHVHWREQGRNALNFQRTGFERAAQETEQAARDDVHVAVARASEMSGAERLARMGALEHRTEQSWTSHQIIFDGRDEKCRRRRSGRHLLSEAQAEIQRHQWQGSRTSARLPARRSTPFVSEQKRS